MAIVGLLKDDTFGQGLSFAEEASSIFLVCDNNAVKDCEEECGDCEPHSEVSEGHFREQAVLDAHNETVCTKVVRDAAASDHMRCLDGLNVH